MTDKSQFADEMAGLPRRDMTVPPLFEILYCATASNSS